MMDKFHLLVIAACFYFMIFDLASLMQKIANRERIEFRNKTELALSATAFFLLLVTGPWGAL